MRFTRHFYLNVITRTLLLALTAVGLGWSWTVYESTGLSLIFGILLAGLSVYLLRYVSRTNRELTIFLEALQYNDFNLRYTTPVRGADFPQLTEIFNRINGKFRSLRAEKEGHHHFLQTIIQQVDTALLCVDGQDHTELWNQAAKTLFHKSYLPNLQSLALIDPILLETLKHMRPGDRRLLTVDIKGDSLRLAVRMTKFSVLDQTYRVFAFQNIHSELEAQESLAWHKLIRILNHEIMNSMAPIVSLTDTMNEWLECEPNDEAWDDLRAGIQAIRKRSEGLLHFTDAYRQLSRLPVPQFQDTDLRAVLQRVGTLMGATIRKKQIQWELSLPEEPIHLSADPELLEQVLINLLTNAIDAVGNGRPDPRIRLALTRQDNRLQITVADNGCGIDESLLDQIFVPFFTTKPTGSGIGLAVCRQLVQMHGGTIGVRSAKGEGTVFTVVL